MRLFALNFDRSNVDRTLIKWLGEITTDRNNCECSEMSTPWVTTVCIKCNRNMVNLDLKGILDDDFYSLAKCPPEMTLYMASTCFVMWEYVSSHIWNKWFTKWPTTVLNHIAWDTTNGKKWATNSLGSHEYGINCHQNSINWMDFGVRYIRFSIHLAQLKSFNH